MARLYYEKSSSVIAPKQDNVSPQPDQNNQYSEKIAKLIPGEVLAGYLSMTGFATTITIEKMRLWTFWGVFFFCLILTPLYLNKLSVPNKPKSRHLVLSTMAFIIWAYVTTGDHLYPIPYHAVAGSILLVAFSLVSGLIPLNK